MATTTTQQERPAAKVAAEIIDAVSADTHRTVAISVDGHDYPLSQALVTLIVQLLDDVAAGRDVTPAPSNLPIGTELASELLGVSRPWLTTLLDRGEIPSTRVGTKRRIKLGDVLAYRRADNERRQSGLTWEFLDEE